MDEMKLEGKLRVWFPDIQSKHNDWSRTLAAFSLIPFWRTYSYNKEFIDTFFFQRVARNETSFRCPWSCFSAATDRVEMGLREVWAIFHLFGCCPRLGPVTVNADWWVILQDSLPIGCCRIVAEMASSVLWDWTDHLFNTRLLLAQLHEAQSAWIFSFSFSSQTHRYIFSWSMRIILRATLLLA